MDPLQESVLQNISSESIFAEIGGDNGLLPIYSLLQDYAELPNLDPASLQAALKLRQNIDALFDKQGYWDATTLQLLQSFINGDKEQPEPEAESEPEPPNKADNHPTVDSLLKLNLEENRELLEEFCNEAGEHLEEIEAALLVLDQDPHDKDAINSVFRSFHTVKGVSGFLELLPLNALSHEVESLLDSARNHKIQLDSTLISLLLKARDRLGEFIQLIRRCLAHNHDADQLIPVSDIIQAVKNISLLPSTEAPSSNNHLPSPNTTPSSISHLPSSNSNLPSSNTTTPETKKTEESTVRVRIDKLDDLIDSVGELVILEAQLANTLQHSHQEDANLQRNLTQMRRIVRNLQNGAMAMRMVPIRKSFRKMERLARDLSLKVQKDIDFYLEGEDTELDRTMVEVIGDPLVHMVRNAIDHGIEPPEERLRLGKKEKGRITLRAHHQGGFIVIELEDDGHGLDPKKLLAKAISKKLVREDQKFSEQEIFNFIFLPGFSTAEKVTDVSGRGVGMDVVRRNIESLRGKIIIDSVLGKGSLFSIKLPLTLAIIDGLTVKVGGDSFILPANSVQLALRPENKQIQKIHGRGETLDLRGNILPLLYLHQAFKLDCEQKHCTEGIIVIVDAFHQTYGLVVDELISKQEVVIKPLGPLARNLPGLLGGAILGDGSIAMIIDPVTLISNRRLAS